MYIKIMLFFLTALLLAAPCSAMTISEVRNKIDTYEELSEEDRLEFLTDLSSYLEDPPSSQLLRIDIYNFLLDEVSPQNRFEKLRTTATGLVMNHFGFKDSLLGPTHEDRLYSTAIKLAGLDESSWRVRWVTIIKLALQAPEAPTAVKALEEIAAIYSNQQEKKLANETSVEDFLIRQLTNTCAKTFETFTH